MIIAADDGIPYLHEAFGPLGEVRTFSGRGLRRNVILDADALIVRTVTPVDSRLLDGCRVRFVGTASIGTDHLDLDYLEASGIEWVNAAGSNANAVSEYVAAALLHIARRKAWDLGRKSIAVIGVGRVGSRVAEKAAALGLSVFLCDPPLREASGDPKYLYLEDVLDKDILTLHVPLTREGAYPTWHMFDGPALARLQPRQLLMNTSRGAVIDGGALLLSLRAGGLCGAVLDVWENEPRIDYSLLGAVDLGTAHVAGFSRDGKVRATEMIATALSRFAGTEAVWNPSSLYPPTRRIDQPADGDRQAQLASIVGEAYDITRDDRALRALSLIAPDEAAAAFDRLRTDYALRPEFHHFVVDLQGDGRSLARACAGLGFQVARGGDGGC